MIHYRDFVTKTPFKRSSEWRRVRKTHIEAYPCCCACGRKRGNEVHHIVPFHLDYTKELAPKNLITLCPRCHLLFGHLGNWRSYNMYVEYDAGKMYLKIKTRPQDS